MNRIKVQRNRGSCKPEDRTPVYATPIPDIWGIEQWLRATGEMVTGALAYFDRDQPAGAERKVRRIPIQNKARGELLGVQAAECWRLAHDLQSLVVKTVEPAVEDALEALQEAEALATKSRQVHDKIIEARQALERVYQDGANPWPEDTDKES